MKSERREKASVMSGSVSTVSRRYGLLEADEMTSSELAAVLRASLEECKAGKGIPGEVVRAKWSRRCGYGI